MIDRHSEYDHAWSCDQRQAHAPKSASGNTWDFTPGHDRAFGIVEILFRPYSIIALACLAASGWVWFQ